MEKARRRTLGIETVEAWLAGLPRTARRLDAKELRAYPDRRFTSGWRLMVTFPPDRHHRLDLLVDHRFPREAARVALVDRPDFLTWPHIERDGVLCILPTGAQVSVVNPAEAAKNLLGAACQLIEDSVAGQNEDEFRAEFSSYWDWDTSKGAPNFYSLINLPGSTRLIRVWRGRRFYLVGDHEQEIMLWLQHRFKDKPPKEGSAEQALLLWLDRPLIPREFPRVASDVLRIAESRTTGGVKILSELADEHSGDIIVVLGCSTVNGPCLAGVTVLAPRVRTQVGYHGHDPVTRGFRPNKMPQSVLVDRHFGGSPILRSTVDRVDAAWVHGRGQDPRFPRLRGSTVAILGVGSVGAPVAILLAEAGIGRFVLVDPDRLKWANVGRHPLGAPHIGAYKAKALADQIKLEYPHIISVDAQAKPWEEVAENAPGLLRSCDLIVSAMGNWAAEGALNEWHLTENRRRPIVYGWMEPHGCAGHAVVLGTHGGCFQCGFTDTGAPLLRITNWPNGVPERQEPACGAVYQPYGPIELHYVVAMISELVLDCILNVPEKSTHRIWAGRRSLLESCGGEWTTEWADIARDRVQGGFIEERPWPNSTSCIECVAGKRD